MQAKIAILVPGQSHRQFIKKLLASHGLDIEAAADIGDIVRALRHGAVQAVVLEDVGPSLHDWLAAIQRYVPGVAPVLVTGPGAGADLTAILACGACDYVDYPDLCLQLADRLRARIGNSGQAGMRAPQAGPYTLYERTCTVVGMGIEISLTRREFSLAQILFSRAGSVVSLAAIYNHLWGRSRVVSKRMIEEHVSNLRHKLQALGGTGVHIRAVVGTGYRLDIE